ncbi:MAG TPA: NUDIX domain-containing protein [Candidatus Saccharimonadales bacterium]|nr:NUDIX domain-containing protein [Candidatus Saccharimonadales bacterium]
MKEEPVDILDEQGNMTGQTMLKSEAHQKGLWHRGAHLWIYNSKGEILIQLRAGGKTIRPNVWDVPVAGHIQAGHEPRETLVRESKEELGLDIDPAKTTFAGISQVEDPMQSWTHRVFNYVYILKADLDINSLKLEKEEVAAVKWIPLEKFEDEIHDPAKSKSYWDSRLKSYQEAINAIRDQLRLYDRETKK